MDKKLFCILKQKNQDTSRVTFLHKTVKLTLEENDLSLYRECVQTVPGVLQNTQGHCKIFQMFKENAATAGHYL